MQIIILGTHRSGTSVVARLINLMGAYIGPEDQLMPATKDNPKGYWERLDVIHLNESLFSSVGISWDRIANFQIQKLTDEVLEEFYNKATKIISGLDMHRPWVVKDPRMCLLFPLWKKLLEVPVCIHVIRHPIQVAKSLNVRDGFPLQFGIALWEKNELNALDASSGLSRLSLSYEGLMEHPVETVSQLYDRLISYGIQGLRKPSEQEIKSFLDPRLFRQKRDENLEPVYLSHQQESLYKFLISDLDEKSSFDIKSSSSNRILQDYEELIVGKGIISDLKNRLASQQIELNNRNRELQQELNSKNATLGTIQEELISKNATLDTIQQELNSKNATLDTIQQELNSKNAALDTIQQDLNSKNAALDTIQQDLNSKNAALDTIQQDLNSKNAALDTIQQDLNSKNKILNEKQEDIDNLQKELTHYELHCRDEDVDRLMSYFERLNHAIDAAFSSLTWKSGFFVAEVIRKVTFLKSPPLVQEHAEKLTREYNDWKNSYWRKFRSSHNRLLKKNHEILENQNIVGHIQSTHKKLRIGYLPARKSDFVPTSSAFIRLILPLRHPDVINEIESIECNTIEDIWRHDPDAITIQRTAIENEKLATDVIKHCKAYEIKIIYEIDDDLFNKSIKTPMASLKLINFIIDNADLVITASQNLQRKLKEKNSCTICLANSLDETIWLEEKGGHFIMPEHPPLKSKVRILFMGTKTHRNDLQIIEEAYQKIRKEYSESVVLEIVGGIPDKASHFGYKVPLGKDVSKSSEPLNYFDFVNWLRENNHWDFAVAPLEINEFNQNKTFVKFLDYSALGLASICSDIDPYREVIAHGENGLLVGNTTNAWYEAIKLLIEDISLRKRIAKNAFRNLISNHILRVTAKKYTNVYKLVFSEKRSDISQWSRHPLISIIMPVYNVEEKWLHRAVLSIKNQIYPYWELCIADDSSNRTETLEYLKNIRDSRFKVKFLKENQGISGATNEAIELAQGEYIALMDNDDEITPDALYEVVKAVNEHDPDLIYSDEDKLSLQGNFEDPHFKPDFSPDLIFSTNYISHLGVYRRTIVEKIGGFRKGFEGSQDYDLLLRFLDVTDRVHHITKILYHWRKVPGSTAAIFDNKSYAWEAGRKALQETVQRQKIEADVKLGKFPGTYRVIRKILHNPLVSIIIPFKDKPDLLRTCIDSILSKSTYDHFEIIGISNNSEEQATFDLMKYYENLDKRISFKEYNKLYNFSAINNYAMSIANGTHLLLLNNDTSIISKEWIEALLEHSQRQEVGAVGGKLYYPDDTIQHAGIIIGIRSVAAHSHKSFSRESGGYFARPWLVQNVSAVTGACLMVKKNLYASIEGLDEKNLAVAFNDVDFCLRLREQGYLNIFTPYCELYHHESKSRGLEDTPKKYARFSKEVNYMLKRHAGILASGDPYYNPNLTLDKEDFSIKLTKDIAVSQAQRLFGNS